MFQVDPPGRKSVYSCLKQSGNKGYICKGRIQVTPSTQMKSCTVYRKSFTGADRSPQQ